MEGDKAAAAAIDEGEGDGAGKEAPLGVKLRRAISANRRGGLCTPVPSWKLEEPGLSDPDKAQPHRRSVSARKLGAGLWEIQDVLTMSAAGRRGARIRRHRRDGKALEDGIGPSHILGHEDLPQSVGSLRRHVEASSIKHQHLHEGNSHNLQPVSPASYTSSYKIAPFNLAITHSSATDLKDKFGDAGYGLRTSTELLKVLNHIWSLEEHNESNASLVKALKGELEHARAQIQELMQEQHAYRGEMDHLMKQVTEDKIIRKEKEQQRIKAVVQSIRDELEDERRLRKRSESLHRKLGKELSEAKAAFMKAAKDLENVRKTNGLLEDLCDEFAKGIRDYEHEVRQLKQRSVKVCDHKVDRLVLHISEEWLDEREQMNIAEARGDIANKTMVADRLRSEIEAFIQASRSSVSNNGYLYENHEKREINLRRQSLESVHLNGAASAPQDADDDDDSVASDLHCFELNMGASNTVSIDQQQRNGHNVVEKFDSSRTKRSTFSVEERGSSEKSKNQISSSLHLKCTEEKDETKSCGSQMQLSNRTQGKHPDSNPESEGRVADHIRINKPQVFSHFHALEVSQDMKMKWDNGRGLDHLIANSVNNVAENSECSKVDHNISHGDEHHSHSSSKDHFLVASEGIASGHFRNTSSNLNCIEQHKSPDVDISRSSSKLVEGVKENTLKARLLEARLEGQQARLKASDNEKKQVMPIRRYFGE
ncbi:uncharacterized protein At5g41620-like isoform X1 [Musa acuminata AAA Group]|uniref:uncharacterized protein At5g41620-like isoform X1 n=1 Tax=Musa acuminata AAA Group TaxID=214697 RepID=UPI0031D95BB4